MTDLLDIDQTFGSDVQVSRTGDLGTVSAVNRSRQRVLRRLLTNPGDYLFHLDYGAGVRRYVGSDLNIPEITANIRGQMLLEESVMKTPAPTISVTPITNGVSVDLGYFVAPDAQPAALSFDVAA